MSPESYPAKLFRVVHLDLGHRKEEDNLVNCCDTSVRFFVNTIFLIHCSSDARFKTGPTPGALEASAR